MQKIPLPSDENSSAISSTFHILRHYTLVRTIRSLIIANVKCEWLFKFRMHSQTHLRESRIHFEFPAATLKLHSTRTMGQIMVFTKLLYIGQQYEKTNPQFDTAEHFPYGDSKMLGVNYLYVLNLVTHRRPHFVFFAHYVNITSLFWLQLYDDMAIRTSAMAVSTGSSNSVKSHKRPKSLEGWK